MLQPAAALQRLLTRLSSGVDRRRRPRAADRDRAPRQYRLGLFGGDLHSGMRDHQHLCDGVPTRLHQPGHLAGRSVRGARGEPRSSRGASRKLTISPIRRLILAALNAVFGPISAIRGGILEPLRSTHRGPSSLRQRMVVSCESDIRSELRTY
jgi:hypothetical protein